MRIVMLLLLGLLAAHAAEVTSRFHETSFEKDVLEFEPVRQPQVDAATFEFACRILRETRQAVRSDEDEFNVADYWNLCVAFLKLDLARADVELAFRKMIASEGSCEYLESFGQKNALYTTFPERYQAALDNCRQQKAALAGLPVEPVIPAGLDAGLVELINQIRLDDSRHRKELAPGWEKPQRVLDRRNLALIDSLFAIDSTYIGRSRVGPKLESVMWAVIQHSDPASMRRYLPVIQAAVEAQELAPGPLKMLLDRLYWLEEGGQLFGSQGGAPLLKPERRREILHRHGLDELD